MLPPALAKADLHLLYVFSEVVEAKGFSAAQISLNVSASTISRQIADLETRLGLRLCERGRKGFSLTDEGKVVYTATHALFASLSQFRETVEGTRDQLAGHLAIAAIDNWVFDRQGPVRRSLARFTQLAPDVQIELHCLPPDEIETLVQNEQVDIGVGVFHNHKPGLVYESLLFETVGLYCAKGHALFDADTMNEVQTLLADANYCKRAYLKESQAAPISRGMKSNASAHQIEGVAMLILTGNYVGYLPESFAEVWVREGQMKSVGGRAFELRSEIKLIRKRGKNSNLASQTFVDMLRSAKRPQLKKPLNQTFGSW